MSSSSSIKREQKAPRERGPLFLTATSGAIMAVLTAIVIISALVISPTPPPASTRQVVANNATTTPTPGPTFDPSVNAPLPNNRIVAAYGITGGVQFNGPASTLDLLNNFLPQLQQLGQQYAKLDPTHPVKLGLDLVINTIQPCSDYPQWCSSFDDDATIQSYIDFCKQHDLLLFFDLQLGVMPVQNAVTLIDPYLQQYPFTELALDTEFHFPNNAQGHAEAAAYPNYLGWMGSDEINWAIGHLAQIAMQNRQPRKVLVVHEWDSQVIHDKTKIQLNPNVSVVLQSDGWGGVEDKLSKYQAFVQQENLEYGGYKLFFQYTGDGQYDVPLQSPSDVMQLFPQPLFVSYQ